MRVRVVIFEKRIWKREENRSVKMCLKEKIEDKTKIRNV